MSARGACVAEARRQDDRGAHLALAHELDRRGFVACLTSNAGSALIAATIACDSALASRSAKAIGMRVGLSRRAPKIAPKNAAMTIGAAIDITSARRFEK